MAKDLSYDPSAAADILGTLAGVDADLRDATLIVAVGMYTCARDTVAATALTSPSTQLRRRVRAAVEAPDWTL